MTIENIALRCRVHNAYEAGLCFGPRRRPPAVRETAPPYGAAVGGPRAASPFRNGIGAEP